MTLKTGNNNTAVGQDALEENETGDDNSAVGDNVLKNSLGTNF